MNIFPRIITSLFRTHIFNISPSPAILLSLSPEIQAAIQLGHWALLMCNLSIYTESQNQGII